MSMNSTGTRKSTANAGVAVFQSDNSSLKSTPESTEALTINENDDKVASSSAAVGARFSDDAYEKFLIHGS